MSQECIGIKAFTAGEALAAYRRVKLTAAGTVSYADADEPEIGVTEAAAASGARVAVALKGGRTHKCVAAGAVTVNAAIYGMADGKVDDTATGSGSAVIGLALETALADGDVIECILECNLA